MQPIERLIENIEKVIVGKRSVIERVVIALLCRGHVLLEDVPGTGKTMMARALSKSISVDVKRLQCTSDLLPSDITGVPIYNQKTNEFEFRSGPIFTSFLLADEINRATPRAQSALLECMEEFRVSVDGVTYDLPPLFMVLATQNPIDMAGTYVLPEAQLDRFLMRLSIGYPTLAEELDIMYAQHYQHPIEDIRPVISERDILSARQAVANIEIRQNVAEYIAQITSLTRTNPELKLGVSPRGTLALARVTKACAYIKGRDYVTPDMVKTMAPYVLTHRMIVKPEVAVIGKTAEHILREILDSVKPPL